MTDEGSRQIRHSGAKRPGRRPRSFLRDAERDLLLATIADPAQAPTPARRRQVLRDRAILTLFVYSGLRRNELRLLDRRDVDLRDGTVYVRHAKRGKFREVPLHPIAAAALRAYLAERNDPDPALFLSNRRRRVSNDTLRDVLERWFPREDIDKPITLHSLRRTFATAVYRKTRDIQVVQQLLGHSNIQTTMLYIQLVDDDRRDAVNLL